MSRCDSTEISVQLSIMPHHEHAADVIVQLALISHGPQLCKAEHSGLFCIRVDYLFPRGPFLKMWPFYLQLEFNLLKAWDHAVFSILGFLAGGRWWWCIHFGARQTHCVTTLSTFYAVGTVLGDRGHSESVIVPDLVHFTGFRGRRHQTRNYPQVFNDTPDVSQRKSRGCCV